jgi:hypothetical protein
MFNLAGMIFELVENSEGHAAGSTVMTFAASDHPIRATYSGPNVRYGEAIVVGDEMLYHAVDSKGHLSAGHAKLKMKESGSDTEMILSWQWLTGERTGGVSRWRRVGT